ncbi:hypothetical protein, partial [Atopococcus tabaci]|uniref:hypothetical protein n=1 Tax=Atopococcus tabaci TaxID=269774 RepID=UPI0024099499
MIKFNNELYELDMRQTRRLLHEAIDEAFNELDEPTEEMEDELQEAHELISAQDEDGLDGFMVGYDIYLEKVQETARLEEALKEAGYQVESSNISRSLYVTNDEGEEVRIADHTRPSVATIGGNYVNHEYENELIVKENKVTA